MSIPDKAVRLLLSIGTQLSLVANNRFPYSDPLLREDVMGMCPIHQMTQLMLNHQVLQGTAGVRLSVTLNFQPAPHQKRHRVSVRLTAFRENGEQPVHQDVELFSLSQRCIDNQIFIQELTKTFQTILAIYFASPLPPNGAFPPYITPQVLTVLSYGAPDTLHLPSNLRQMPAPRDWTCAICQRPVVDGFTLPSPCHFFHQGCIQNWLALTPNCPVCFAPFQYQPTLRLQPTSLLTVMYHPDIECRGYRNIGTIMFEYVVLPGFQKSYHPWPRQPHSGGIFKAYIPPTRQGIELAGDLQRAFEAGFIFRIAEDGSIEWAIEHLTNLSGGGADGYPNAGYLARLRRQLDALQY